jgi:hypothetical protein
MGGIPCKKIKEGTYSYRGWIIQCVGYYDSERRAVWEAYDPETGCVDFHAWRFSKREIKRRIDENLSKNGR